MTKINVHVTYVVYHEDMIIFETDNLTCKKDVENMFENIGNRHSVANYSINYHSISAIVVKDISNWVNITTIQFNCLNNFYDFITGLFSEEEN